MLKTLIYFPPEYRDLAHKTRENYIEHHHGEVDLVSETDQKDIEYAREEKYDDKVSKFSKKMKKPIDSHVPSKTTMGSSRDRRTIIMKTVKEVSKLTGISVRTLHYYDEIGLFLRYIK